MFIVILSISFIILLAVLRRTLLPYLRQLKMRKRLVKEGVEAEAVLLNMQQTGLYINNLPQLRLQLQVYPRTGRDFMTETLEVLSFIDLNQLHIGGSLLVKFNPVNTKEVMVLWQGATTPYPF